MKERPLISIVWRMLGHVGRLVSGSLPGSVHDMKAAWIWASEPELTAAGLPWPTKAIKAPCTRERPTAAGGNRNHRKRPTGYAKLRAPGERENTQLKAWKILTRLRCASARRTHPQSHPRLASPRDQSRMKKLTDQRRISGAPALRAYGLFTRSTVPSSTTQDDDRYWSAYSDRPTTCMVMHASPGTRMSGSDARRARRADGASQN